MEEVEEVGFWQSARRPALEPALLGDWGRFPRLNTSSQLPTPGFRFYEGDLGLGEAIIF